MVESEMKKVYELAKELGVDSISLLDKLNSLNIKVKSHMSELGPDEIRAARASLGKKDESAAKKAAPKRTTTTRKKPATEAPAGATAAAPATPVPQKEAPSAEKRAASPIIRRRGKADGVADATPMANASARSEAFSEAPSVESNAPVNENTEEEPVPMEAAVEPEATESAPEVQSTAAVSESFVEAPSAPEEVAVAATPTPVGRPAVVLPPRPVAPKRSFLKIVEASAPPPRPMIKPTAVTPVGNRPTIRPAGTTTGEPSKDGFRIIKMDKANLDQMVEEEAAKKRGGGREMEIRPEDVRFADYRKKEMVFLPKRKKLPLNKELKKTQLTTKKAAKRVVEMGAAISVQDLANQLGVKAVDVVRKLMGMGQMATINHSLDFDTTTLVAAEYKYEVKNVAFNEAEIIETADDSAEQLKPRPPVVTIMGHVDHGKTSLLDAIREANVAGGEAGGITQHIGAYTVEKDGKLITFIDTPGHEAFTAMRTRGANVTDIVILVVAADDGVMPQTREALSHAQAAGVPIIVAVNKIDKAGANPEKIKQGLSELNLLAEDWGGQTMFVPVSATKKTNLDKLLEAILLQAEVLDLKANPDAPASGTVLETRLEKGRGPVTSVLVKRGTLRVGDAVVSGAHCGRVKALTDDKGKMIKQAGPGFAAEILGFESLPNAGEVFNSTEDEVSARMIVENRTNQAKAKAAAPSGKVSLEELFSKIKTGAIKELNVIVKADMFGSVEAIRDSLAKLSTPKVTVKVILAAPGGITESDVLLASASQAIIIGFNVRPETKARQLAESSHIEIKTYTIIYELIDDIKLSMVGLLDKKKVEKFLGRAEVRQTFNVPKVGTIAGTAVIDGKITRGANIRLLRDSRIIFDGKLSSLKRFKDDAKEVASGYECGIGIENYNDLKPGDLIEAYQIDLITPELNS